MSFEDVFRRKGTADADFKKIRAVCLRETPPGEVAGAMRRRDRPDAEFAETRNDAINLGLCIVHQMKSAHDKQHILRHDGTGGFDDLQDGRSRSR